MMWMDIFQKEVGMLSNLNELIADTESGQAEEHRGDDNGDSVHALAPGTRAGPGLAVPAHVVNVR